MNLGRNAVIENKKKSRFHSPKVTLLLWKTKKSYPKNSSVISQNR